MNNQLGSPGHWVNRAGAIISTPFLCANREIVDAISPDVAAKAWCRTDFATDLDEPPKLIDRED